MTQFLTGHDYFRQYLNKYCHDHKDAYFIYNEDDQTVERTYSYCPQ